MKKKATSTALVIPQTITPKPTKNDIVNAMVERARVKWAAENDALKAKRETLKGKIITKARAEFKASPPEPEINVRGYSYDRRVEFTFDVKSPEILKMLKEYDELPKLKSFDEKEVRAFIRRGMSAQTGNAVQSLLANPDAVKALDASLEHIGM